MAAQNGADAGFEFVHIKGFDDVVVCAAVQACNAAVNIVAGGENQHGGKVLLTAQVLQYVQSVPFRQPQIQQQQIIALGSKRGGGGVAVIHPINGVMAVAQVGAQGFGNHAVVFGK